MYKITKISLSKLVNTGNFSNCSMSLEAEVKEEADVKQVTKELTKQLDHLILVATDRYKSQYDKYKEMIQDKYGSYTVSSMEKAMKFIADYEKGLIDAEGKSLVGFVGAENNPKTELKLLDPIDTEIPPF